VTRDPHASGRVLNAGSAVSEASLAVVLLHGRGGSAEDILGLASAFDMPGIAYFAPQAAGHTWYPLSFMAPREANEPYVSSALAKVDAVLRSIEQAGLERNRIVVAGFSQGACLATEFVASHAARYGGLIAFTGGLIGAPGTLKSGPNHVTGAGAELAGTPALLSSGDPDPHVPWQRVEESAAILRSMGAAVTTKRYPGRPHTITSPELAAARSLLAAASID
jgi:phospholipase/carboxylesterase